MFDKISTTGVMQFLQSIFLHRTTILNRYSFHSETFYDVSVLIIILAALLIYNVSTFDVKNLCIVNQIPGVTFIYNQ